MFIECPDHCASCKDSNGDDKTECTDCDDFYFKTADEQCKGKNKTLYEMFLTNATATVSVVKLLWYKCYLMITKFFLFFSVLRSL